LGVDNFGKTLADNQAPTLVVWPFITQLGDGEYLVTVAATVINNGGNTDTVSCHFDTIFGQMQTFVPGEGANGDAGTPGTASISIQATLDMHAGVYDPKLICTGDSSLEVIGTITALRVSSVSSI
jgi:hypothetical protein